MRVKYIHPDGARIKRKKAAFSMSLQQRGNAAPFALSGCLQHRQRQLGLDLPLPLNRTYFH